MDAVSMLCGICDYVILSDSSGSFDDCVVGSYVSDFHSDVFDEILSVSSVCRRTWEHVNNKYKVNNSLVDIALSHSSWVEDNLEETCSVSLH